ncbi:twin-arginine translocase subunit TatC [Salimicrobium flavidum]|uniref:Sec-independent protein translocase protein TatC n=1 Tax=Salimicrobium flavidum TaxID=570947 RepID=A0A1N7IJJ5_9BACI|nr:twin-arginine translocase subunit TatC [Salimicrobium flavidum]SIS37259.1 sec-independent protein translocase protein TatC [Salimicrobium flavidum]
MADQDMDYIEHFGELRKRIILTLVTFIAFFVVGFLYHRPIQTFFLNDVTFELHMTSPGEIIWIVFTIATIIAIAATLPMFSFQLWLFIKPALTKKEKRVSLMYIPFIFLLFVGGLVFGYFIFIKFIMPFLLDLNDGMFTEIYTVERYFKFLFRVTVPFAVFFEIPLVLMFLTSLGIVNPQFLVKVRKYAYLILVIMGTILSPPDFILQLVVAVPLILLYEISIILSRIVFRKRMKQQREWLDED